MPKPLFLKAKVFYYAMQFRHPLLLSIMFLPLLASLFFFLKKRACTHPSLFFFSLLGDSIRKEARHTRLWFRFLFGLCIVALVLLAVAIARPFSLENWSQSTAEGIDILFVLDVSESMEANDLIPSRIIAARKVIQDFIKKRKEDRFGLVIFGGNAITKSPLTSDHDFLLNQVEDSRTHELKQGTAIGMGISNAVGRLRHSKSQTKVIILLTDGDSNVGAINPITAADLARQDRIKIYTIGIGSKDRVVVPIFAYDIYGNKTQMVAEVPSYLNPELLEQMARMTGGRAYMARDSAMLGKIVGEIGRLEKSKIVLGRKTRHQEKFLVPALIATLCLFVGALLQETRFRRRKNHALAIS